MGGVVGALSFGRMAKERMLTIDDLQRVVAAVYKARVKWKVVGLELGLPWDVLEDIDGEENAKCLTNMLAEWLKRRSLYPSWRRLVKALKAETVVEEGVACEIEREHLEAWNKAFGSCFKIILISISVVIVLAVSIHMIFPVIPCPSVICRRDHNAGCDVLPVPLDTKLNSTIGPNNLPILPSLFIGRDEDVGKITNVLLGKDKSWIRVVCVYGPPAVGKSTLAVHVGYEIARRGTAVRYINMNDVNHFFEDQDSSKSSTASSSKPISHHASTSLAKSVTDIHFPVFMSKKQKYEKLSSISLLEWAKSLENNTLLIIDNCDELLHNKETRKHYEKLLEGLIRAPWLHILTTHQHRVCDAVVGFGYPLTNLSDKYAVELLYLKTTLLQEQAETIAELVGNNPLALHVVGSLINNNVPVTVVIKELKEKLLDTLSPETLPSHQRVRNVLEVSIQHLHSDYRNCACIVTVFPGSFSEEAGREVLADQEVKVAPAQCLKNLVDLSLLDHYWYGEQPRYQFHKLIKEAFNSSKRFCRRVHQTLNTHIALRSYLKYYSQSLLETVNRHGGDPDNDEIVGLLECDAHNFHLTLETVTSELNYADDENDPFMFNVHKDPDTLPHRCIANALEAICMDRDGIVAIVYPQKQLVTLIRRLISTNSGEDLVSSNSDVALGLKTLVATTVTNVYDCPRFCAAFVFDPRNLSAVTTVLIYGSYLLHHRASCYIDCVFYRQVQSRSALIILICYATAVWLQPFLCCHSNPRKGFFKRLFLVWFLLACNQSLWVPMDITERAESQLQSLVLDVALKIPIISICIIRTGVMISCIYLLALLPLIGLSLSLYMHYYNPLAIDAFLNTLNICVTPVIVSVFVKCEEATVHVHSVLRLFEAVVVIGCIYASPVLWVLLLPIPIVYEQVYGYINFVE